MRFQRHRNWIPIFKLLFQKLEWVVALRYELELHFTKEVKLIARVRQHVKRGELIIGYQI